MPFIFLDLLLNKSNLMIHLSSDFIVTDWLHMCYVWLQFCFFMYGFSFSKYLLAFLCDIHGSPFVFPPFHPFSFFFDGGSRNLRKYSSMA